jgi:ABC-type multidrug transport system fused ATPase/permease subunit
MQFVQPGAEDRHIIEALEKAELWNLFLENGQGLDAIIGERGVKLSGGQKQRISIARIFLKKPSIILFDEATSALDSETEQKILATMEKALVDRTSIIITHRLATIQKCHNIIVIDGGELIGQGTHRELLTSCSLYKDLYTRQELQH